MNETYRRGTTVPYVKICGMMMMWHLARKKIWIDSRGCYGG
jgi:hypothetical protein